MPECWERGWNLGSFQGFRICFEWALLPSFHTFPFPHQWPPGVWGEHYPTSPFWAQTWEFWERYSFVFGMLPGVGPPRRVIPTGQSFLFLNSKTRVVWLSQHGLNFQFSFRILLAVFQFSSGQLCPTSCDPMDCSTPGFPVHITNSRSLLKLMSMALVMPSNHLILCHLLLPPSIFPSIGVFSDESALRIRWPKILSCV